MKPLAARAPIPRPRNVGAQAQRDWFRPNPPLPRVNWSIRNNINLQQSAILFAISYVANNRERFLNNFYLKSRRAVAKANNEGPAAWIIPGDTPRPVEAADTVNLLRLLGVEVHTATNEFTARDQKMPAGSYVVRMDQPYSRMADMLLDTQYYNVNDPRPYDDTGWTLGALRNVKTVRVTDKAVLNTPMVLLTSDAKVTGRIVGPATNAYVINHNTENTLATLRYRLRDVRMEAAEEAFKVGNNQFSAGSFIIKSQGAPPDLRSRLESAVIELGLTAHAVEKAPEVKSHELSVPRVAILHTWTNTQNEGWYRIEFDRLKIPYAYISVHEIRETLNLREKYDVIIFPPVGGTAQSIVNGIPRRGEPIPWRQSELTPNMGGSPDTTDDMRGGIELRGMMNLQKFIEEGGLFIPITSMAAIPIDYGITSGVTIQEARQLQARGSVFNASFSDRTSPISYGYGDSLQIYFSQAPLFNVAALPAGGGGGGGGGPAGPAGQRPSGRGSINDPDVIQAMPRATTVQPARTSPDGVSEELRQQLGPMLVPPNMRPRVVLRFANDEKTLLVSGMLAGGSELAGKPAVVDVPVGRGHVVLFATNPMWRHQTQGEFFLLFNAILNFNHLGAGRTEPASRPAAPATGQ